MGTIGDGKTGGWMRLGYFTPAPEPTHLCPYPLEADKSGGHLYCKKAVAKGCSSVVFENSWNKVFSSVWQNHWLPNRE